MNEAFKNDPILRAVVVTFAGLIVFGFLFGFNFGGGSGEMGGSFGYPGNFIGQLITFLMHILMMVLVVTLIGGFFIVLKKFYSAQESTLKSSKSVAFIAQDPVLKTAAYVFGGIVALYLLCAFLKILFLGYLNPYFLLMALIGFLVKLLSIGLVAALAVAIYQYAQSNLTINTNNQGEAELAGASGMRNNQDVSPHQDSEQVSTSDADETAAVEITSDDKSAHVTNQKDEGPGLFR